MVRTSNVSGTHSCPIFLILCTAPSLLFIMPPRTLQPQLLLRLLVSAPAVAHQAISPPSSLLPFSIVLRTYHTYAVRFGIFFVVLMDLFLLTSSEIFVFFFCWMQGWGVLVCPWSSSRARSRSDLTLTSLISRGIWVVCCVVWHK
jgi:hypothetical protein